MPDLFLVVPYRTKFPSVDVTCFWSVLGCCTCACSFVCCIGAMLPGSPRSLLSCADPFSALWLLVFFSLLSPAFAVCSICFGSAAGCGGDGTSCPWVTGVAANVAAVAAATGGVLKVASLLPPKFLRLFPRAALESLSGLVAKVNTAGTPFDPTGKSTKEVVKAVKEGRLTRSEAILHFNSLIQDSSDELEIKKLESASKILEHLVSTHLVDNGSLETWVFICSFQGVCCI